MTKQSKVNVQEAGLIVGLGKSKRLAAMRQSIEEKAQLEAPKLKKKPKLNKKEAAIQEARERIEQKIQTIKAGYPSGRQNKLFALRYGDDDKLNELSLKQLFTLLNISADLAQEISDVKFLEAD